MFDCFDILNGIIQRQKYMYASIHVEIAYGKGIGIIEIRIFLVSYKQAKEGTSGTQVV